MTTFVQIRSRRPLVSALGSWWKVLIWVAIVVHPFTIINTLTGVAAIDISFKPNSSFPAYYQNSELVGRILRQLSDSDWEQTMFSFGESSQVLGDCLCP